MPRPVGGHATYLPALDGVRALAVLAVLGYHFGIPWMSGGLLGVGVFFTLSGFLITGILLDSWERTGGLELRTFWLRRARRLLPALLLVLTVVVAVTALVDRAALGTRWNETLAAVFYVSNWATIANDVSYFEQFAGPGPLDHLWSLAIEEQFYLVWPLLLLLLLRLNRGTYALVARCVVVGAAASFVLLNLLAHPGFDNTRAYEGTDTRAGELLVGAALALVYRPRARREDLPVRGRLTIDAAGVLALGVLAWLVVQTTEYSMTLYRGGLVLLALSTGLLLAVVVRPSSLLGRALSILPLRWLGERSYGIYLWHMPIVALTPQSLTEGFSVRLVVFHLAATLLAADLSWRFIENPIRMHGWRGAFTQRRWVSRGPYFRRAKYPTALKGTIGMVLVGTVTLACSAALSPTSGRQGDLSQAMFMAPPDEPPEGAEPPEQRLSREQARTPHSSGKSNSRPGPPQGTVRPADDPKQPERPSRRAQTSCESVVHVGDSTSLGLTSVDYLPDPGQRIDAQYRDVGVDRVDTDILGARSIVETYKGQPNADDATQRRIDNGYDGCWVFAMGTNDSANQFVGGVVSLDDRIGRLMDDVGDQPAMWLTVKSRLSSGPWNDGQMQKWNDALLDACAKYPNMRVFDWRSEVQDDWFISDGIHFTSTGYRFRAAMTANALATAFPVDADSPDGCLVGP